MKKILLLSVGIMLTKGILFTEMSASLLKARELRTEKKFDEALTNYQKAIEEDSTGNCGTGRPGIAYYEQGWMFEMNFQKEEALSNFQKALELFPDQPDYLFGLTLFQEKSFEYADAAEGYKKIMSIVTNERDAKNYGLKRIEILFHLQKCLEYTGNFSNTDDIEAKTGFQLEESERNIQITNNHTAFDFIFNNKTIFYDKNNFDDSLQLMRGELARDQNIPFDGTNFLVRKGDVAWLNPGPSNSFIFGDIDLGSPCTLDGVTYHTQDSLTLDKHARVKYARFQSDNTISGITFQGSNEGDTVDFYENGCVYSGTLKNDTLLDGLKYQAGSKIDLFPSGKVSSGFLTEMTTIQNIPVKPGFVLFNQNGNLRDCTLSKDYNAGPYLFAADTDLSLDKYKNIIQGTLAKEAKYAVESEWIKLFPGTRITLDPAGRILFFIPVSNVFIGGNEVQKGTTIKLFPGGGMEECTFYKTYKSGQLVFEAGRPVAFFRNGKIRYGTLAEDCIIQGYSFLKGQFISFYQNGSITGVLLNEPRLLHFKEGDFSCRKASRLVFYPDGSVRLIGYDDEKPVYNGMLLDQQETMYFYPDGRLNLASLAYNTNLLIGGADLTLCRGGFTVLFNEKGIITGGQLQKEAEINGIRYARSGVSFYPSGKLRQASLHQDTEIQGIVFRKGLFGDEDTNAVVTYPGTPIQFYESGKILSGELASNQTINGEKYLQYTAVDLYENGKVKNGMLGENKTITMDGKKYTITPGSLVGYRQDGGLEFISTYQPTQFQLNKETITFPEDYTWFSGDSLSFKPTSLKFIYLSKNNNGLQPTAIGQVEAITNYNVFGYYQSSGHLIWKKYLNYKKKIVESIMCNDEITDYYFEGNPYHLKPGVWCSVRVLKKIQKKKS